MRYYILDTLIEKFALTTALICIIIWLVPVIRFTYYFKTMCKNNIYLIFSLVFYINIEKQARMGRLEKYIAIEKTFESYI